MPLYSDLVEAIRHGDRVTLNAILSTATDVPARRLAQAALAAVKRDPSTASKVRSALAESPNSPEAAGIAGLCLAAVGDRGAGPQFQRAVDAGLDLHLELATADSANRPSHLKAALGRAVEANNVRRLVDIGTLAKTLTTSSAELDPLRQAALGTIDPVVASSGSQPAAVRVAVAWLAAWNGSAPVTALLETLGEPPLPLEVKAWQALIYARLAERRSDPEQTLEHVLVALQNSPALAEATRLGLRVAIASNRVKQALSVIASTDSNVLRTDRQVMVYVALAYAANGQGEQATETAQRAFEFDAV